MTASFHRWASCREEFRGQFYGCMVMCWGITMYKHDSRRTVVELQSFEVRGTKESDSVLLAEICNGKVGTHGYIMFASVKSKR